jgi:phosphoenolpyruvate carboxykinase (ATP)
MHASPFIDVESVDNIILITRGPTIPAISRLTRDQAVALMVLGQAMESSAGDPTKAGSIRTEFFYDPFVAGDLADHANRFHDIVREMKNVRFYLLNTGGIGEGEIYRDIRLEHTMGILDSLLRGGLSDWIDSPTGFKVPKAIRNVDDFYLHPEKVYPEEEFFEKQKELNRIRNEAVEKIGGKLHPGIRRVFNK